MSITSKVRRDAKKRRIAKARNANANATAAAPVIEPHAELRDDHGQLLGGIVRRDGEWTLGLGGRIVGGSDSAARVLAMLKRAATLHDREGMSTRLTCSNALQAAAAQEVVDLGMSFGAFEAKLAEEMATGMQSPLSNSAADNEVRH